MSATTTNGASSAGGSSIDQVPRSRVFAHPKDVHCALYHVICLVAYGVAFWIWNNPAAAHIETTADWFAFVAAAGFLLGWISGIDVGVNFHNHTHRRIFRSRALNTWFGRLWTFSGGWPSFYWNYAHVTVHHSNVLREGDWTLPKRRADGTFESIYSYVFLHWPWRYAVHLYRDFTSGRGGGWVQRRAVKELLIFAALWSIPFWIDFRMALCLWVLPHWVGNGITMAAGMYVQHAGGVSKSTDQPYSHSNTYLSKFFNLTMFNIGYHIEHHDYPHVHWSELPAFHETMREKLKSAGAHVLPYGYYRAASIFSDPIRGRGGRGLRRFVADQAPAFQGVYEPALERRRRLEEERGGPVLEPARRVVEPQVSDLTPADARTAQ